jgi:hypothetical protein
VYIVLHEYVMYICIDMVDCSLLLEGHKRALLLLLLVDRVVMIVVYIESVFVCNVILMGCHDYMN